MDYDYVKQGDCLELMKEIPDGSVDMILCDLPYGTTQNKWDVVIPYDPLWEQYKRIIKENGAIVLFSAMPFTAELACSNRKMFRYEWIYQKTRVVVVLNANKMPLRCHENILVFYKKLPTYNPQFSAGEPYKRATKDGRFGSTYRPGVKRSDGENTGYRFPTDIIKFNNSRAGGSHPTQKPVSLLEYLIKTYTNEGETVLDNCMGSGSTCVAAINTGRHYIGFEKDPQYFEIAKRRIEEARA